MIGHFQEGRRIPLVALTVSPLFSCWQRRRRTTLVSLTIEPRCFCKCAKAPGQDSTLPDILLDPVGVFTQSANATAGSIFSNVTRLIETIKPEDVEVPDDAAEAAADREGEPQGQAPGEGDAQAKDAAESIRRRCRRSAQPLNEFTDNATLLYGAFWPLFPLRAGLRGDGPLTPASRRHLLTQFHNAFAHSPQLIFLLADQVQRHAAARGVALRVKADTDSFNTFAATVANEGSFLERLEAAKNDPLSRESRALLKHVSRFVVSSGKAIP